jgi:hypothetical protein
LNRGCFEVVLMKNTLRILGVKKSIFNDKIEAKNKAKERRHHLILNTL